MPTQAWSMPPAGARNYYLLSFMDVYSRYIVHHELLAWMDGQGVSVEASAAIAAAIQAFNVRLFGA